MHLLYFHGSTLQAFWSSGKFRFLDALNPDGMFDSVHMVNLDLEAPEDIERFQGVFRFTAIGLGRYGRGWHSKIRALWRAIDCLSRGPRPDLVLADDANALGLTARAIARRLGVRYGLCVYYDNDIHYRLTGKPALAFLRYRWLESALERTVFKGAVGIYAGNAGYRDYGLRHGADPRNTYLGVASVDDIFYGEPGPGHPDSREILFVGRLHPLKYIDDLIRALVILPSSLRLDIAGEGTDRSRLEQLGSLIGVSERLRFLGMVPREDLLPRMWGARVLVVTQGFNAAVESLLSGRPVVAYDHECNAEVVRDGETGLLTPFRDVGSLAGAIERLTLDSELARRLGQRGRERMIEEYGIATSIRHRRNFFVRCLQR
jgi:glycosyltransferase involved in cell wall biosynthesis